VKDRGADPERVIDGFVDLINASVADAPDDMVIAMHHCRGNYRSKWMAEGGYEPIADVLFERLKIGVHFMEFDDARSGSFEPLRRVRKGTRIVLGLISSKLGALEEKEQIKRRIDEAARYVDMANLCLSPQCGFASTEEGNELTEEQQWAKLRLVRDIADEMWGKG
jgi:5-methyltetrahydropteroyltriglutamate--homocysteine methyltransferase